MKYSSITGWGMSVPERVLTNCELEQMVDTSDEWIVTRTGIRERRIAGEGETTATLSVAAGRQALERAGLTPEELDLIIVATSSPDHFLPPVSSQVQHMLGATRAGAFALVAGCTGFAYALATAHQFIATGAYRNVLVIGTEIISRFVNWQDRNTCVLFGDASGAVLLQASDQPSGVLSFILGSDGSQAEALIVRGLGSAIPASHEVIDKHWHQIEMDGPAVFKFAVRMLGRAAAEAVAAAGLTLDDIALFIPHQANLRIIEAARRQLGLSPDKVFINLERYGNTSAASIPVALCEALDSGRVKEGDTLVMVGFGGGLTWAAVTLQLGVATAATRFIPPFTSLSLGWPITGVRQRVRSAAGVVSSTASSLLLPLFARSDKDD
jgi:3-oxoacyl-[acyl-carrier-protein] synthase-3